MLQISIRFRPLSWSPIVFGPEFLFSYAKDDLFFQRDDELGLATPQTIYYRTRVRVCFPSFLTRSLYVHAVCETTRVHVACIYICIYKCIYIYSVCTN